MKPPDTALKEKKNKKTAEAMEFVLPLNRAIRAL